MSPLGPICYADPSIRWRGSSAAMQIVEKGLYLPTHVTSNLHMHVSGAGPENPQSINTSFAQKVFALRGVAWRGGCNQTQAKFNTEDPRSTIPEPREHCQRCQSPSNVTSSSRGIPNGGVVRRTRSLRKTFSLKMNKPTCFFFFFLMYVCLLYWHTVGCLV